MAERKKQGGTVSSRRLKGYQARVRELTDAFNLPTDLRVWVTLRMDTDEETEEVISVGGSAGRTNTVVSYPLPENIRTLLEAFLEEHREEMEHQLKLDLATNLLASMTERGVPDDE